MKKGWTCINCGAPNGAATGADTCWQCGTLRLVRRPLIGRVRNAYRNYRKMGVRPLPAAVAACRLGLTVCVTLALVGCAQPSGTTADGYACATTSDKVQNAAVGAGVGGAAGLGIGALADNKLLGTAIGAALGGLGGYAASGGGCNGDEPRALVRKDQVDQPQLKPVVAKP